VIVKNSVGATETEWVKLRTNEAIPDGLMSPDWYTSADAPNQIFLKWEMPERPSGGKICMVER